MIPKIIHYCWFGGNPKPKDVERYIASWRKFCPDYEIKEWNESNFDIHLNRYCEEAYEQKKWAFVSDVARLWALCHEGGIYMDTDVEVIRPFDDLLVNQAFIGFEGTQWVATNIIGTEKEVDFFEQFLDSYKERTFIKKDGSMPMTTNVEEITRRLIDEYGLRLDGNKQKVGELTVYPSDYFSPYDYINGKVLTTVNTYTIHWFAQSWIKRSKLKTKFMQIYHRMFNIGMK